MISDALVAKTAAAMSTAGILLLFFVQQMPQEKTIGEALKSKNNELLSITAKVDWEKEYGSGSLFELNDGNKIIAFFSNPSIEQKALIERNNTVKAIGKISKNKKETRIIVQEVQGID